MRYIALAAGLLFVSAGVAQADESAMVVTRSPFVGHVAFNSADLRTPSGVSSLRFRVRAMTQKVCAPQVRAMESVATSYATRDCNYMTLRDAFAQVDQAVSHARQDSMALAMNIEVRAR